MKNNKGFTMVEILSVIIILGLIMILVFPSVNEVLFSSKKSISDLNRKNLEEAGKTLAEAIYICDDLSETVSFMQELGYTAVTNCKNAREQLTIGITVRVEFLKKEKFFTDNSNNCSGEMKIFINDSETMRFGTTMETIECQK